MDDVIITTNEHITVKYVPDKGYIYHVQHQPTPFPMFREALNAGTAAMEKYGVTKWLSDDRNSGPIPEEQNKYAKEEWTPRTVAAGWKYWALIVPTEVVSAGSMMPLMNIFFELGVRMMVFDNYEAAVTWLDQVETAEAATP